jgi:hypothetical protein
MKFALRRLTVYSGMSFIWVNARTSSHRGAPPSANGPRLYGDNRSRFGTPETSLRGKRIRVTRQISDYQGKPEIVLTDPIQLTQ